MSLSIGTRSFQRRRAEITDHTITFPRRIFCAPKLTHSQRGKCAAVATSRRINAGNAAQISKNDSDVVRQFASLGSGDAGGLVLDNNGVVKSGRSLAVSQRGLSYSLSNVTSIYARARNHSLRKGIFCGRRPVACSKACEIAGANGATMISPAPCGGRSLSTITGTISGISAIESSG
jgi:hypothetical protein